MRVLGFGTYDTSRHPRVGILLDGLRAGGADVLEANAPLGLTTAERVEMLRRPWKAAGLAMRLARRWAAISRDGRAVRRAGPLDAVVVGYLGHFDVILARLLFPRDRIVLDLLVFAADTARDRGGASPVVLGLLSMLDRLASACADVIVVDTTEHTALLSRGARTKAVVVPVGAPSNWFSGPTLGPSATPSPLRVIFYGLYTPLQGAPVIGAALAQLRAFPGIRVTMVGTGQDLEETRRLAGGNAQVTWLGWVDPGSLPDLVASHDVCLGIFGTTPKALRVVPNKVFQGAAAGCAIVTSGTPPQRLALGDVAVFTDPGDPQSLADALRDLSADHTRLWQLRLASAQLAKDRFTPEAVTLPLRTALARR